MNQRPLPSGIHYLLEGYRMLFVPGLRRFLWLPLFMNGLFFAGLFFFLSHYFSQFDAWLGSRLPVWLIGLETILWIIFLLVFFMVSVSGFSVLMTILAAPFNSLLAEKAEQMWTAKPLPMSGWWGSVKDIPRLTGRQIAIIVYYLPRLVALLLLFLIPGVNFFAPFCWFLFNAWFMCLQFLDFPTDIHRVPIRDVRRVMEAHRWLAFTFGVGVLVGWMIPIVNLCTMPAAVVGATRLWLDIHSDS